jgi:hypothetical protein
MKRHQGVFGVVAAAGGLVGVIKLVNLLIGQVEPVHGIDHPYPIRLELDRVGGQIDFEAFCKGLDQTLGGVELVRDQILKRRPVSPHFLADAAVGWKLRRRGGLFVIVLLALARCNALQDPASMLPGFYVRAAGIRRC